MISGLAKFLFLRLMGWKIEGQFPSLNKFIVAVFPHNKNFDFIVAVSYTHLPLPTTPYV